MVGADEIVRDFDPSDVRYGGLVAPISRSDLQHFKEWTRTATFEFPNATLPIIRSAFRLLLAIVVWVLGMAIPAGLALIAVSLPNLPLLSGVFSFSSLLIGVLLSWRVLSDIRQHVRLASPWKHWLRLSRFGHDNGLFYLAISSRPPMSGTIFTHTIRGEATDRLVSRTGRRFEIGNYAYDEGDESSRRRGWGYMAIGLDRVLPHMVLRAAKNTRWGRGLPGTIAKDQALRLEGDFNKHFTLYAPRAYERDALYVFAPDLMALMIDEAAAYEVEIVDDWIFFYSPKPFDLTSRRTLRGLFRIARLVGAKTFRQTDRYWDERGGSFIDNHVAAPGQRLRARVALGGVILVLLWGGIQLVRFVTNLLDLGVGP